MDFLTIGNMGWQKLSGLLVIGMMETCGSSKIIATTVLLQVLLLPPMLMEPQPQTASCSCCDGSGTQPAGHGYENRLAPTTQHRKQCRNRHEKAHKQLGKFNVFEMMMMEFEMELEMMMMEFETMMTEKHEIDNEIKTVAHMEESTKEDMEIDMEMNGRHHGDSGSNALERN